MFSEKLGQTRYFLAQRLVFTAIGIDFTNEEQPMQNPLRAFLSFFVMVALFLALLHFSIVNISDIEVATDAMKLFCQIVLSSWKFVILVYNHKLIMRVVKKLMTWNRNANHTEGKFIIAENGKDVIVSSLYCISVFSTVAVLGIQPFIVAGIGYIKNNTFKIEPPIKASYFVDYSKPHNYVFVYLWVAIALYNGICITCGTEILFSWLMRNLSAQFDILQYRLHRVAQENGGNVSTESIIDCIQYHRRIIITIEELSTAYSPIIFFKFSISCIQLCLLAYRLSQDRLSNGLVLNFFFLLSVAQQLLIYSHGGQTIKYKSQNIAIIIYKSFDWHKMDNSCKKLLLLTILRAQRHCFISGIFFEADYALFVWVFRTAASYFTLLLTLAGN
ncbi:odorant receptor 45a-like [Teleopsis dalmanni]|uniref:odorant receptor 45a-like n=1 Tax=Teleopsis dalmanni TaxID=139649 RepID=UPI0018CCFFC6|nr:odorant receptor 45a-like [Teleopsis dalmanni]